MVRPNDLARLRRLVSLCDARHHLAIQEEAEATHQVDAAARRRQECEAAVAAAQQGWQRLMESPDLGPDLAVAAGDVLIERANALTVSVDREREARDALAARGEARREAGTRFRQAEAVTAACRQKLRRRRDERMLAAIEDRIAYQWRRA